MDRFLRKHLYNHPCPTPICLPTDKYTRTEKVRGIKKVCYIQKRKLKTIYQPMLASLKEKYKREKRCFIIGNGPSINNTDLSKLIGEITFSVNNIFLKFPEIEFRPTFYVVEDHLVAEDRSEEINNLRGVIKFFPVYLAYCLNESPDTIFFNHRPRKSAPLGFDFSTNAAEITYTGGTVTFTCLQLAYYFGFKEIYLIGVDHSYSIPGSAKKEKKYNIDILDMSDDDPNHFAPDYFGKGYRWHDPRPEVMEGAYREALKITVSNGVKIYNATIGGCLEVFPRVNYDNLFDGQQTQRRSYPVDQIVNLPACYPRNDFDKYRNSFRLQNKNKNTLLSKAIRGQLAKPRVLIVSNTLMNRDSATGSLIKNLFTGWPKAALAQVYTNPGIPELDVCDKYFCLPRNKYNFEIIKQKISEFNPEVIYLRPTHYPPILLDFVYEYLKEEKIGLVTHIMDDWPERARVTNPELYRKITPLLCKLFRYASYNLSIGDLMSNAFEQRYEVPFRAVSNFIDPKSWEKFDGKRKEASGFFTIRYNGSLTMDMQLESVKDVARAVSLLQDEIPVRFEIYVHRRFRKNARKLQGYRGTDIFGFVAADSYQAFLANADLLLLPANFDSDSLSYIRYSIANKMPEYMASGTPILAYGPTEAATIKYAKEGGWAKTITKQSVSGIADAIREFYHDVALREDLGKAAQRYVFKHHRADQIRSNFQLMLVQAKIGNDSMDHEQNKLKNGTLIGEYDRSSRLRVNESEIVAQFIEPDKKGGVMIDVGAHFGSALPPFLTNDWKVYAFEPDSDNRRILTERFGDLPNLVIDKRAVSDKVAKNVQFFSSKESSGISSLTSFHRTHESAGYVNVTTLEKYCEEQHIENIDFLLIDAEGYDLFVLQGIDWAKIKPEIIICEFEDRKTKNIGYTFHDLAKYLQDKGYEVLVSEWHPIRQYGIAHDWRKLARYPCQVASPDAWGNLIAFSISPDWQRLLSIAARHAVPASERKKLVIRKIKAAWGRLSRRFLKNYW